jgi:two-component system, LytTR family, sensor histidine kinase AlgZ
MHPLFTRGRFGLYLVAWIPLAAILTYLMASGGRMGWLESAVVAFPLCVVYAFICLSAWYSAKSAPLNATSPPRLWLTHVLASAFLSLVWVQLGRLFAYLLSRAPFFSGLSDRFSGQFPILFGAGFLFYLLAVSSSYVILSLETSREAEARAMETSVLARDAELKALKAQVNPHFLFNSLNSISALTSVDPAKASEMCLLLAEFLRMTLGLGEKNGIPLSEELSLLERFLAIEKVRFGARLQMQEEIQEESKTVVIPPLILQPLVENAIVHGIANLSEGGNVRLASSCQGGHLSVVVENTYDPESTPNRRSGMGLANVRRRLEARYGNRAVLRVVPEAQLFRVALSLPIEPGDGKN